MTPASERKVTAEKIMQYAWAYAPPLIIEAAIRNQVFEILQSGPKTLAETSTATGASERGLRAIMDALIGLELLTRDGADRYALSPEAATFLVAGKPTYIGGLYKHISRQLIPRWLDLAEIVRTGHPAFEANQQEKGAAFFESFVSDLFGPSYPSAQTAAQVLGVAKATAPVRVLDLACGSGVWSIAFAQQSPRVTVTAVDWPMVLEVTRKTAAGFGLADRYQFIAGDLAEADFGQGHNVALLGHILHSEGREKSRNLLRKTFNALAPDGVIVIAEYLVNDDRKGPAGGLLFGVNMLVNTENGDTYSFEEIRGWLHDAGFTNARTVEAPGPSPLIMADKPR
jgi:SAM-dependent methyltransferase